MYEPHLVNHANDHAYTEGASSSILDELDKIAPLKSFDAFPKVRYFQPCNDAVNVLDPIYISEQV